MTDLDYRSQLSNVLGPSCDPNGQSVERELTFGELETLKRQEMKLWDSLTPQQRLKVQIHNDRFYRPIKIVPRQRGRLG